MTRSVILMPPRGVRARREDAQLNAPPALGVNAVSESKFGRKPSSTRPGTSRFGATQTMDCADNRSVEASGEISWLVGCGAVRL